MGNSNNKIYKNIDINEFDKCCDSPKINDNKKNENKDKKTTKITLKK
tara:strand:- start:981 stop:1121 length:141 start_codon:yes stop_codon:yes gene_type:complete